MEEHYLPVLSHFQNGNVWTGSDGRLRYRLTPEGEILRAEAWEGPWSYALSQVEEEKSFPLDEGGLAAVGAWIQDWSGRINARPAQSLAQTIQARDARQAELAAAREEAEKAN